MSKYTKERIEEMTKLVSTEIPMAIASKISIEKYYEYRVALNLTIIQAIFGIEIKDREKAKKDGKTRKIKFNHKRADVGELATISRLLNDFIGNIESPFFASMQDELNSDGYDLIGGMCDDMNIPNKISTVPVPATMPDLDKVTNSKIYDYILGNDLSISKMLLTGMDVYELAAVAKKVKKVKKRNTMLIAGGIALILTGGTIAAVTIINHNKKKDDIDVDDYDIDLDDIDIDVNDISDIDMDDIPNVEMPE